jgi:hypothetical protein
MLETALFTRKLTFVFHFMMDPDPNPVPELDPESECIPVPRRLKVTVPAVPVPQHCLYGIHIRFHYLFNNEIQIF